MTRHAAGKVLASEAELYAIRSGVNVALRQPDVEKVVVFTDSMQQARRAVDPSVHAGQAHSLSIIRCLQPWLQESADHVIEFVYVPSKLGWGVHKKAHDCLKELPRIPGRRFEVSIGMAKQWLDKVTTETWQRVYWPHPEYKGRQFYELYTSAPTGRNARREATPLLPTLTKGGTWLPALANKSTAFVARFTRAVLNHAPIGEYYERFHIEEDVMCQGCGRRETRNHILTGCLVQLQTVH